MNEEQKNQYKAVKQNLSSIQLKIKNDLKAGNFPRLEDTDQFIAITEEMNSLSAIEWSEAMDKFMKLVEEFKETVKSQNQQLLQDTFQKLLDSKASCHKKFR